MDAYWKQYKDVLRHVEVLEMVNMISYADKLKARTYAQKHNHGDVAVIT